MTKNIAIIGSGFVGLTLAAYLIKKTSENVYLYENDESKKISLEKREYFVVEPELADLLNYGFDNKRLFFNTEVELSYVFITIGTPKNFDNNFITEVLVPVCRDISHNLILNGSVFLRSTIAIGVTNQVKEIFVSLGRKDVNVYFAPERTAEGVAVRELILLPQIIGASSNSDIEVGAKVLESLNFQLVKTTNAKTAELSKLICNTWRDVTFGYANEIANISKYYDINAVEAIKAANENYPRSTVPLPGPVGGPCLTKDSYILFSAFPGSENSVILAARRINEEFFLQIAELISKLIIQCNIKKILLCGLAFKGFPKTNDYRNSLAEYLIKHFNHQSDIELKFFDSDVSSLFTSDLNHLRVESLKTFTPELVVFCNNSKFFMSQEMESFLNIVGPIVIDTFQILSSSAGLENRSYRK